MFQSKGKIQKAYLKRDLRRTLKRGHPFVYQDAIDMPSTLEPGALLELHYKKQFVAYGYADPEGMLAFRVLSTHVKERPSQALFQERLHAAQHLRQLFFPESQGETNAYRLVNGEGDLLPGLVIDRYGEVAVIKTDGPIAEAFWDTRAIAAFLQALPWCKGIYYRERSRGGAIGEGLFGAVPDAVHFQEYGARFLTNVKSGQKTGFFLDQRENRRFLGSLAKGKTVLNMFSYTGGFSVQCGRNGAKKVTSVDLAEPAILDAKKNWALNDLPDAKHEALAMDAFQFLEDAIQSGRQYELVILDPPAFAPSNQKASGALDAYERLASLGAQVTAPQGLFFMSSCSAHIDQVELLETIEKSLARAKRTGRVLSLPSQQVDHPYPLVCRQLAYLKSTLLILN